MGAGCTEAALRAVLAFLREQPQGSVKLNAMLKKSTGIISFQAFSLTFCYPTRCQWGLCPRANSSPWTHQGSQVDFQSKNTFWLVLDLVKHTHTHVHLSKHLGHLRTLNLLSEILECRCFFPSHQSSGSDGVTGNISSPIPMHTQHHKAQHKLSAQEPAASPLPLK